jgi:hypothetical protein
MQMSSQHCTVGRRDAFQRGVFCVSPYCKVHERLPVWHRGARHRSSHLFLSAPMYLYTCALDWCCGLAQLCCDFPFSCARLFTELHRRRVLFLLQLLHNCSHAGCVHLIAEENCGGGRLRLLLHEIRNLSLIARSLRRLLLRFASRVSCCDAIVGRVGCRG